MLASACLLALLLLACGPDGSHADGAGALEGFGGDSILVSTTAAEPGQTWSAGSWPLCRTSEASVWLRSIRPVGVVGDIDVEAVLVQETQRLGPDEPAQGIGLEKVVLPRSKYSSPEGFEVVPRCGGTRVVEVAAQVRKVSDGGGALDGLRVEYEVDGRPRWFVLPATFVVCGAEVAARYPDNC